MGDLRDRVEPNDAAPFLPPRRTLKDLRLVAEAL
jgi:hypothetical protein